MPTRERVHRSFNRSRFNFHGHFAESGQIKSRMSRDSFSGSRASFSAQKPERLKRSSLDLDSPRSFEGEASERGHLGSAAQLLGWRASRHRPTRSPSTCAIRAQPPLASTGRGRGCRALLVALLSRGILGNAAWNGRQGGVRCVLLPRGAPALSRRVPLCKQVVWAVLRGGGASFCLSAWSACVSLLGHSAVAEVCSTEPLAAGGNICGHGAGAPAEIEGTRALPCV